MKVGVDISQIAHRGGVSGYTRHLAQELSDKNEFDLTFLYYSLRIPFKSNLPNVKTFKIPPTVAELMFNKFRFFPVEKFIGNIDLFHSSDWVQPPTKAKKVTTYHDVIPLKFPHWSHPKIVEVHKRRINLVKREIDRIIAVSNATKQDLVEITHIPENKITVIYQGAGNNFVRQDEQKIKNFVQKYNLPNNFVLVMGGIGERKNMQRIKEAAEGFNLVITGETIPWVEDDERPLLYSAAEVLLYPSLYEGFGLPILEAMACGCSVITSNISSMPEVAGNAALYVNPLNVEDIKEKLTMLMNTPSLKDELVKKGLDQSKKFSWQKCIDETVNVYKSLLNV